HRWDGRQQPCLEGRHAHAHRRRQRRQGVRCDARRSGRQRYVPDEISRRRAGPCAKHQFRSGTCEICAVVQKDLRRLPERRFQGECGKYRMAAEPIRQKRRIHENQRRGRSVTTRVERARQAAAALPCVSEADRGDLQLPSDRRDEASERPRFRHCDRYCPRALALLGVVQARCQWPLSLQERDSPGDRRYFREAWLHLGRQVVSLRYDAELLSIIKSYQTTPKTYGIPCHYPAKGIKSW